MITVLPVVGMPEVHPGDEIADLISAHAPLTRQTFHLLGEPQFRAMKPTAIFVNTGRGKVVDEQALIRALQGGWIAGAGLDVTVEEPLPRDNPLWDMPNVIVTPRIGRPIAPKGAIYPRCSEAHAIACGQ